MLEAATAAAVQMMDVDDNAGVDSSLGSTSISCGAGQALQLAAEHMAVIAKDPFSFYHNLRQ